MKKVMELYHVIKKKVLQCLQTTEVRYPSANINIPNLTFCAKVPCNAKFVESLRHSIVHFMSVLHVLFRRVFKLSQTSSWYSMHV